MLTVAAEAQHLNGMVAAHIAAFPGEFLSLLGPGFLRSFYKFYNGHANGISIVVIDRQTRRVMGLVTGGDPDLRPQFLRSHLLRFVATSFCKALLHHRVRMRLLEHFYNALSIIARKLPLLPANRKKIEPPKDPDGTWSNLLSICTHPDFRSRGVAIALMKAFRDESKHRGYKTMRLSVHNDNVAAIALYKKAGWKALLTVPSGTYFKRSVEEQQ